MTLLFTAALSSSEPPRAFTRASNAAPTPWSVSSLPRDIVQPPAVVTATMCDPHSCRRDEPGASAPASGSSSADSIDPSTRAPLSPPSTPLTPPSISMPAPTVALTFGSNAARKDLAAAPASLGFRPPLTSHVRSNTTWRSLARSTHTLIPRPEPKGPTPRSPTSKPPMCTDPDVPPGDPSRLDVSESSGSFESSGIRIDGESDLGSDSPFTFSSSSPPPPFSFSSPSRVSLSLPSLCGVLCGGLGGVLSPPRVFFGGSGFSGAARRYSASPSVTRLAPD